MDQEDLQDVQLRDRLPHPLSGLSKANPQYWLLPATALSLASLGVLLLTLVALQLTQAQQLLFELPFPPPVLSVPAFLLACAILLGCRGRPSGLFPRLWATVLALIAMTALMLSLGQYIDDSLSRPWMHALVVATFAATIMLLPRLSGLRPASPLMHRVVLLTFIVLMPAVFGGSIWAQRRARGTGEGDVDEIIERLRGKRQEVEKISNLGWRTMHLDTARAVQGGDEIERLSQSCCEGVLPTATQWQKITFLQRTDEVVNAYDDLLNAVARLELVDEREPRLSNLEEPALQEPEARSRAPVSWERAPQVTPLGQSIVDYHLSARAMLFDLQPADAPDVPEVIHEHWERALDETDGNLTALAASFTDGWVVPLVEPGPRQLDASLSDMSRILQADMIQTGDSGARPLAAADFAALMKLGPRARAAELDQASPNCVSGSYPVLGVKQTVLECTAYAPDRERRTASPRLHVRVVWSESRVDELYLIFAVAPGEQRSDASDFMAALRDACRQLGASIEYTDKNQRIDRRFYASWGDDAYSVVVVPDREMGTLRPASAGDVAPDQQTFEIRVVRK